MWQDIVQRRLGVDDVSATASLTQQCLGLDLPQLGYPSKKNGRERFDEQTYSGFAEGLQKRNQHVVLTKALVDEAFRLAAYKIPKRIYNMAYMQKMSDRCLGPESSKYWKERR
ncbi:hypothetical protein KC315_g16260 [Hortaea werneckii]|nr:hypothetical protein KC315_g16260 [Hortaea werneckii]KAI7366872.1 hypothetical protein KC354_g3833 [Hortaea werneckii]